MTKANWGIATTLLLGCLFTAIAIIAGNRKDELLKTAESEREERIAQAQATAELARTEQKRLELGVAQAQVEQETLRKQNLELQANVEKERAARLRIEERLAPRRLTDAQALAIRSVITTLPRQSITVITPMGIPEPLSYAQQIKVTLEQAGWSVNGVNQGLYTPNVPRGIFVRIRSMQDVPPAADALSHALMQAGIGVIGEQVPSMQPGQVELLIGTKDD